MWAEVLREQGFRFLYASVYCFSAVHTIKRMRNLAQPNSASALSYVLTL